MEQHYYTKEELELLNTPSSEAELPSEPVRYAPQNGTEALPASAQQEHTVQMNPTSIGIGKGAQLVRAVFSIVFGLVFMGFPLMIGLTLVLSMKETGDVDRTLLFIPLVMVSIFVFVGGRILISGIMTLVKFIKKS